jgi:PAS domain S-box-containing protein
MTSAKRQSPEGDKFSQGSIWLFALVVVLLVSTTSYLLIDLYWKTWALAETNKKVFVHGAEKKAGVISEYLAQRVGDLEALASLPVFSNYYHSKSSGASMEYGLMVLTGQIEGELGHKRRVIEDYGSPVFGRIVFYDLDTGKIMASPSAESEPDGMQDMLPEILAQKNRLGIAFGSLCGSWGCRTFLYGPVTYEGKKRGVLAIELSVRSIRNKIQFAEQQYSDNFTGLLDSQGRVLVGPDGVVGKNVSELFGCSTAEFAGLKVISPRPDSPIGDKEIVVLGIPLGRSGFTLLTVAPEFESLGSRSTGAWPLLTATLMGALFLMLGYVFRSYQQRHKMYWALDSANRNLEERVKQRTAELEKSNLELIREMSERKEAERKIYQQAQVLSSIKDSIFIISSDMKVLYANQTACDMFGQFLSDSPKPLTCYEVLKRQDRICQECPVQRVLETMRPYKSVTSYIDHDGNEVWVFNTCFPYYDDHDNLVGSILLSTDYTAQKETELALQRAKDKAEEASRAKTEFLARISHEIRTPLYGILGTLDLFLDSKLDHEQRELLLTAKYSAEGLHGILTDVLDFSKVEAGRIILEDRPFSLWSVVESVADTFAVRAYAKDVEFICDIDIGVPEIVVGDEIRVRQVLMNLVGNAVKFTGQGEISIRVSPKTTDTETITIEFIISDTGIGIPGDKLKTIFDPFSQAEGFISRTYGGTGLGLPIAKSLLELMGGEIELNSALGRGTSFKFQLDFNRVPDGEKDSIFHNKKFEGTSFLVVDKNESLRKLFAGTLSVLGAESSECSNVEEAYYVANQAHRKSSPFSVIILDINCFSLSDCVSGLELNFAPETPVVIVAAAAQFSCTLKLTSSAPFTKILKPVKKHELIRVLESYLSCTTPTQGVAAPVEDKTISSEEIPPKKLHVLVAEDNAVNQKLISRTLEKNGISVTIAENGKKAVDAFKRGQFDLILMDVQMPEMDGITATTMIREEEKNTGKRIPIIAMTAHAFQEAQAMCMEAGMDSYLSKPVNGNKVLEVIDSLVKDAPH